MLTQGEALLPEEEPATETQPVPEEYVIYRPKGPPWTEEEWYTLFMGGCILIGPNHAERLGYHKWLDWAGIQREFADDPDVRRMYYERRLPPVIARHEFFFLLRKGAPQA